MSFTVPKIAAIAPTWLSSSESTILSSEDVHLWLMNVESCAENLLLFEQILSPDEQARAAKFRQEGDRARFIIGRGILRHLLSCYTGLAPSAICFSYNSYGKPALKSLSNATPPLQFNLSHSGGLVLYGFTQEHPIGVDLEQHRPLDVLALAQSVFSESERAVLNPLPPAEQLTQFLQLWTCKEAYVKAIGLGLSGLEQVEMAIASDGSVYLAPFTKASSPHSYWRIQPVSLGDHVSAAFAVNIQSFNLCCYQIRHVQDLGISQRVFEKSKIMHPPLSTPSSPKGKGEPGSGSLSSGRGLG
ncbi:4'-phosphopantetheinyl transferase superfamily protein [Thermoleptolyngbya sp. M55_K2018_002]|uniref:4'-phosphopantetheinyl transferase family protein n=1 Tax=Thermoleptolyngbya sp. M55_K2018_002 TaxID=2747808 RepID=UPI0019E326D2|nr:4'-phosphopantetheinyl transferase superfamily protein [Thermoleptolyngbya sp. M55_K2018_002]HIK42575.1 4'-phosphopantetheinyl transferase superfamily protein [Thermoleptolyngbya sp. M55_K2018_002]